jgi:tRNA (cmo5U34)-methyltransferase
MTRTAQDYYAEFSAGYAEKIRQLVPRYDEMLETILDLLQLAHPGGVLDIGAGVGNVSDQVLRGFPEAHVTALDASPEMLEQARTLLAPHGTRASVVRHDIAGYSPGRSFDAVFSNLVLHNLPPDTRRETLGAIRRWLEPGGVFIWGEMIVHPDPAVQQHFARQRAEHALAAGCPQDFVDWNFEKESTLDHPWTTAQTLEELAAAGFDNPEVVWAHDAFAVFFAGVKEP